jgi:hypothetical protein
MENYLSKFQKYSEWDLPRPQNFEEVQKDPILSMSGPYKEYLENFCNFLQNSESKDGLLSNKARNFSVGADFHFAKKKLDFKIMIKNEINQVYGKINNDRDSLLEIEEKIFNINNGISILKKKIEHCQLIIMIEYNIDKEYKKIFDLLKNKNYM